MRPFRSLRWRATFWTASFLMAIAVAIRLVNYDVTREILLRDVDTQLWTRLAALRTAQHFAPDAPLETDPPPGGTALPDVRAASDLEPSLGMRLLMPSAVSGQRFAWFAGVWREDGTPVGGLRLPDGFSWQPRWRDRLDTIWTTPTGDLRLAACRGGDETVLLVGTSLAPVRRALRDVRWFHAWTVMLAMPPLGLAMWWILSRMMRPLGRITGTAAEITQGDFAARIDLGDADTELVGMAATLNGMLDRLDAIRAAQARFNTDLAHELLNPIHGILVQADVSRQRPRTAEELGQTVEHCRTLAVRIQKLSEALLALAKAESAPGTPLAEVDLEPIVDEAVAQVEDMARARQVTLAVDAQGAVVSGTADLLHQVFVNLLANAIDHSPAGGVVDIATARVGDRWVVRVTDHGAGVPADRTGRLFDRFFRVDESRQTATGGHGLGLAICRGIMLTHGGDVVHRPTPGGGATFEVRFTSASSTPS